MFLLSVLLNAQAPAGYYDRADGTKGAALKTALCNIIYSHKTLSYDALWDAFRTTDRRADGKVWDMYSSTTNYTFGTDQAGNNTGREGGNYNREHSFPKSWFDDARPMYTDLFHLYPTDTYVNGMRSNLPFGETSRPTYSSNGGFSKVGPSSVSGYSGKVFEPNDEYKGDFARTYFYMATCYENQIASWHCDMLSGNKYPAYANWALQMLLRWAEEDPVSEKETDRNNAVYKLQGNRNPYIDFPGLEQYVWGDKKDVAFDPDNYDGGDDPEPPTPDVAAPTFSPAGGTMTAGTTVTISTTTKGADICYAIDGGSEQQEASPVRLTIDRTTSITARALLDGVYSPTVSATYVVGTAPQPSDGTYVLVNSVDDLTPGAATSLYASRPRRRSAPRMTTCARRSTSASAAPPSRPRQGPTACPTNSRSAAPRAATRSMMLPANATWRSTATATSCTRARRPRRPRRSGTSRSRATTPSSATASTTTAASATTARRPASPATRLRAAKRPYRSLRPTAGPPASRA